MKVLFYIFGFALLLSIACEEVDDPASDARDPGIRLDFVGAQTKEKVNMEYDSVSDTLTYFQRSYRDSLENEDPDTTFASEMIHTLTPIRDSLKIINDQLNAGRAQLDSVFARGGLTYYTDTINSVFNLPLNIQSETSTFIFYYYGLTDSITFSYKTRSQGGIERINVVAYDIKVPFDSFDSLSRHNCFRENCTNNEVLFKAYF